METTESQIRCLVESAKIGKVLKEKLINFARSNDVELDLLKTDIHNLKADYAEKSERLEEKIRSLQNDESKNDRIEVTSFEMKINILQKSLMDFKAEFVNRFNSFEAKFTTYADVVKNGPVEVLTEIGSKLDVVKEKMEADTEQKQIEKKALNIIVFNIPENKSVPLQSQFDSCKKDFKVLQDVLGENRIEKHELKSLYRIGKFEVGKVRPIIVKLNDAKAKERLIKLRNLKYVTHEFEVKIYINPDRTIEQLKTFKKLREELKIKQAMAEKNNLNVRYVIKNNKIIEATNDIFRYDAHKLWDE